MFSSDNTCHSSNPVLSVVYFSFFKLDKKTKGGGGGGV